MRLHYFLALARPANVLTAITDIAAGAAIAGFFSRVEITLTPLLLLGIATSCLYAGGIVFNDYFDIDTDRKERPERILPRGLITLNEALVYGIVLYLVGILMAFIHHPVSGLIALAIVVAATIYDKWGKHHQVLGPLNMGLCRGLNLLLGMSIVTLRHNELWWMCMLPIIFVAAITLTSQGEVEGNNKREIAFAILLDVSVAMIILWLGIMQKLSIWSGLPFLLLWLGMNLSVKLKAIAHNEPATIQNAVKISVLSLIPLNAVYIAGFGHWIFGLVSLLCLPLALLLAQRFAVT